MQRFESRTNKTCGKASEILKQTESVTLGELLNFSEDQSHYFEFENVLNDTLKNASNSREDYLAIPNFFTKLGKVQAKKVLMEQQKNPLSPAILPFQTDPLKNAFMQLSIIYFNKREFEKSKEMILLAVRDTDIKLNFRVENLLIFGKTCLELADETKDSKPDLSKKFLIAAKDYISEHDQAYAEDLSDALDAAGLTIEASRSRHIAIDYYKNLFEYYYVIPKMESDPSLFISLMNLYAKEEMHVEFNTLVKKCFPNNQNTNFGLTENQLQIWDVYQRHLPAINLASTLDAI